MKVYKGLNQDLKCRNFQFEIGKQYEESEAKLCEKGFHACEYPLAVFNYYPPTNSRYCEAELEDVSDKTTESNTKRVGKRIKLISEIGIKGIVDASVKFIFEKVDWKNAKESNTGDYSAATNTGDQSAATNTGDRSAATNTGDYSAATNTGYYSAATNTGYYSAATNTGDRSAATNTGDYSAATNTGNYSAATNTGYYSAATNTGYQSAATNTGYQSAATNTGYQSVATNTGDYSAATVEGKESIALATGYQSKVKGKIGCWLVVAELDNNAEHIIDVQAIKVDGEEIKEDVFYVLSDGTFKEAV